MRPVTEYSEREAELLRTLAAIPEIAAAGFSVAGPGIDGAGVTVMRRRALRGRWRAHEAGFAWVPANATEATRIVPSLDEAVRETLLSVLTSLLVARKRPAVPVTVEAILPNPASRVA